jgi:nicotinamide-nucleotide adenylyltransferase
LIIIVGSSQLSHELENPFTAGERVTMIKLAFEEEGLDQSKFFIIPVSDAKSHAVWVNEVQALTPIFNIVYSNDSLTRRLFKEAQVKVKNVPFYHRDLYSSSEVRRRILDDEDWESLLPISVADYIKKIDGVSRIKELALSEKV